MNTFFNSSFPEHYVHAAWRERKARLHAESLQDFNDLLYQVVSSSILSRRADLMNALLHAVNTATHTSGVSIPLWTYHTAHYKDSWKERHTPMGTATYDCEAMEEKLRRKGYHWLVGTVELGFRPNANLCANETEEDGYVGFWDHVWGWNRAPRSVHEVVRATDFCNRIALLFGDDRYRVSWVPVSRKYLTKPLEVSVEKVELRLHYHPRGLYDHTRKALLDTKLKYQSHVSCVAESWRMPYVWTGAPGHRETEQEEWARPVEPESPGLSNRTPTPPPLPASPPPLARRTNGGGLSAEDLEEVAQRLSFEEAPASVQASAPEYPDGSQLWGAESLLRVAQVHHYEGPDALERCARDAVAEWTAEAEKPPCHCNYHHSEAE